MTKVLYAVYFGETLVFNSDNDVQAFGFALGLHQQSNVAHVIYVRNAEGSLVATLTLSK